MKTLPHDQAFANTEWSLDSGEPSYNSPGLTKREYFATAALQGLLASDRTYKLRTTVASEAVALADALLEALNK